MRNRKCRSILRYGLAVVSVIVVLLITLLTPLGTLSPTALFFAAVMISSWWGGLGPGLVATATSVFVIDLFLFGPAFSLVLDSGDIARIAVFVLEAVLISGLNGVRKRLEDSLRQRNRELSSAHQHKDAFLATLGHELRNLLSPVGNGLAVLRERTDADSVSAEVLGIAQRHVQSMARLIDDLLDIARVNQGKITLSQERINLTDVVAAAIEASRPLMTVRDHQFHVSLPDAPVWIEVDPTRLGQILVNLLNNAAKYTEPGGQVWLSATHQGQEVTLRIRDTGVGISNELLPKIFDLYTQGNHSSGETHGGLGIGLSLVRKLTELHGGTIEAFSGGPGEGTEFVVRLPCVCQALVERSREILEQVSHPLRVLIVDDSDDASELLAMLLRTWGHDVITAANGFQAIEAVATSQLDVALLDIGLPDVDGYEVAQRLRMTATGAPLTLIAVTGYGSDEDQDRGAQAGFDAYLTKPLDVARLRTLLDEVPQSPSGVLVR